MAAQIREREGFVLVSEPECSNVCFFHIPSALRSDPIAKKMLETEPVGCTPAVLMSTPADNSLR